MERLAGAINRLMISTGLDKVIKNPDSRTIITEIQELKESILISNALKVIELKKAGVSQSQIDEAIAYVKKLH
jgi:hypothetical protein